MIAAERDEMRDADRLLLEQREAPRDVAQGQREIADVGEVQPGGIDPGAWMFAVDEHVARLANGSGPEARTAAIGRADVEGRASYAIGRLPIGARHTQESRRQRVCGNRVHRYVPFGMALSEPLPRAFTPIAGRSWSRACRRTIAIYLP